MNSVRAAGQVRDALPPGRAWPGGWRRLCCSPLSQGRPDSSRRRAPNPPLTTPAAPADTSQRNTLARKPARAATRISSTPFRRTLTTWWRPTRNTSSKPRPANPATVRAASTPSRLTAADIRNPAKLKPAAGRRVCLTCHLNQPTHVAASIAATRRTRWPACSCHSIHKNGPDGLVARKTADINRCAPAATAMCGPASSGPSNTGCRKAPCRAWIATIRTAAFCRDRIQTVSANEPGCFKCHGDMAGPFTYEHAPVRLEGCTACHQPHGSANPRMLTRAQVGFVCLECHANLPHAHAARQRNSGDGSVRRSMTCATAFPELHRVPPEGAWLLCESGATPMRYLLALLLMVPALAEEPQQAKPDEPAPVRKASASPPAPGASPAAAPSPAPAGGEWFTGSIDLGFRFVTGPGATSRNIAASWTSGKGPS